MTDQSKFLVILKNFDYSSNPIGYVDLEHGCVLKLNDKQKITADDINTGKLVFAPSYVISKEEDGFVKEITVDSFSLITQK